MNKTENKKAEPASIDPMSHGIHAIMQDPQTNQVSQLFAKNQKGINEQMGQFPSHKLLSVFKGKQMKVQESKTFLFS